MKHELKKWHSILGFMAVPVVARACPGCAPQLCKEKLNKLKFYEEIGILSKKKISGNLN